MLKVVVAAISISFVVLVGMNVAIQRNVCHQSWADIDLFQVQRCEPVGLVEFEMEQYRMLADENR